MAKSILITTPMPTAKQVARSLGVSEQRRARIARLAQKAVDAYYQQAPAARSKSSKKAA